MKRTHLGRLAIAGSALGIAVSLLGLPYGRLDYAAFAGLYHNNGTPSPGFHVAIDCNPVDAGVQDNCEFSPFTTQLDVAVTIGNNTGTATDIGALNFEVVNPDTSVLVAPDQSGEPFLDRNPDFNQAALPSPDWNCEILPPDPDNEEPDNPDNVYPPSPASASVFLTLEDVAVYESTGIELLSCNPVIANAGECFGARVTIVDAVGGCPNDHDCDGFLDTFSGPPPNHVGPQNFDTNYDNCPTTMPNPDQMNTDGNWIDLSPPRAFDDATRIMSDAYGDRCDNDLDNDGLLNPIGGFTEDLSGCPSATGPTSATDADTDGDLFLDGAECALGTDPTDPLSKPALSQCGPLTDGDGDGIIAAREFCFYNSSDSSVNSDSLGPYGDPWNDGCEVASVNADTVVNVLDLQVVASHFPGGVYGYHENMDVNKDTAINVLDLQFVAAQINICV